MTSLLVQCFPSPLPQLYDLHLSSTACPLAKANEVTVASDRSLRLQYSMKANHLHYSDPSSKLADRSPLLFAAFLPIAMAISLCTLALVLLRLTASIQAAPDPGLAPLDPQLTNSLDTKGGPTLYYNGSGDVPPCVKVLDSAMAAC